MESLPVNISVLFVFTSVLTLFIFYKSSKYSKLTLLLLIAWMTIQGLIGFSGFYAVTNTTPPRFLLMVLPMLLTITLLFNTQSGKQYIEGFDIKMLTLLHVVRIPVELVLFQLSVNKLVPELMTFEGRNFDIISGITAPLMYYFGFVRNQISPKLLLLWNYLCLILLINIVVHAVLSAPFSFQQFAFDQPNIAVLYFPFNWLPSFIVPVVLFSHLVTIKKLHQQIR